ncbi:MAG: YIP1 family protein [Chloroflexota bacterium]|nr:YIP1 family protein [Chloroflexota bacterium]
MIATGHWLRQLWTSYRAAVIKPHPSKYEAELPRANWPAVWFGLFVVGLTGALTSVVIAWLMEDTYKRLTDLLKATNLDPSLAQVLWDLAFWGGPLRVFISPFVTFFLGALFLAWMSRLFGGRGRAASFKQNFLFHCYLLSLVYTPLRTVMTLLSIIPFVGNVLSLVAFYYQVYCSGVTLQVSHGLSRRNSQWVVWLPQVVWYIITTGLTLFAIFYLLFASLGKTLGSTIIYTP